MTDLMCCIAQRAQEHLRLRLQRIVITHITGNSKSHLLHNYGARSVSPLGFCFKYAGIILDSERLRLHLQRILVTFIACSEGAVVKALCLNL